MLEFALGKAPSDVVLLHGAGGNNLLWRRTMKGLSGKSKALAVNLPGHPSGTITCTTIGEYADALHDFILESGLERPTICGHSMGGAVCLALALNHGSDLGGLVLVSTGAKLGVDQRILEGLRKDPMKAIEQVITPWSFNAIDLGLGREARTALSVSNLPVFLSDYLACQGFDARWDLWKITVRTLVICGDKDRMTPPSWSHFLAAKILGSDLYFVKDSGHMMPLEKPESLAQVILKFLESRVR